MQQHSIQSLQFKITNHLAYKLGLRVLAFNKKRQEILKEAFHNQVHKSLFFNPSVLLRVGGGQSLYYLPCIKLSKGIKPIEDFITKVLNVFQH